MRGHLTAFMLVAGCLCSGLSATAQGQVPVADRVVIAYEAAASPAHAAIRQRLIEREVLEKARVLFASFRLPKPLALKTAGCDGEVNAWFDGDAITICYEYVAYILDSARSPRRPAWVTEADAITGAMIDVILHEGAHALFDYLDVPVLGREEDAADQVAAYLLLSLGRSEAPRLLAGIVYTYLKEAGVRDIPALKRRRLRLVDNRAYADPHSTPVQRMYNTLCLALGAAPDVFGEVVRRGALPADRADGCAEEFGQVDKAFRRLLLPHIDGDVLLGRLAADSLGLKR